MPKRRKLVRDRIPEIVAARGVPFSLHRLSASRFPRALREKIREEAEELFHAKGRKAALNELIDLQELVDSYRRILRVPEGRFREMARRKRLARGGFRRRILMEYREGR